LRLVWIASELLLGVLLLSEFVVLAARCTGADEERDWAADFLDLFSRNFADIFPDVDLRGRRMEFWRVTVEKLILEEREFIAVAVVVDVAIGFVVINER
jgi:hypothetical protein